MTPGQLPADSMELMREISIALEDAGIPDANREAQLIVSHYAGRELAALWRDRPLLDKEQVSRVQDALARRLGREPLQYILGEVEFWGLHLAVGPGVLIPRPKTEMMVEVVLRHLKGRDTKTVLDLCAGSGCLSLALARELPDAQVTGTDISPNALGYATRNAIINGIPNARFLEGSLFGPVEGERFDLIVSNPPYIPSDEIPILQPEIVHYEPHAALDGGPDGLSFYRMILSDAQVHLTASGLMALELGIGQANAVSALACKAGMEVLEKVKDLAGIERVLVTRRGK